MAFTPLYNESLYTQRYKLQVYLSAMILFSPCPRAKFYGSSPSHKEAFDYPQAGFGRGGDSYAEHCKLYSSEMINTTDRYSVRSNYISSNHSPGTFPLLVSRADRGEVLKDWESYGSDSRC